VPTEGWGELSVQAQAGDPASSLELCRAALALRQRLHAEGLIGPDDPATASVQGEGLLVAERPGLRLVVNLGEHPEPLPEGEVLLASGPLVPDGHLPPDTAAWLSAR
jgi:alpha-glucosidase